MLKYPNMGLALYHHTVKPCALQVQISLAADHKTEQKDSRTQVKHKHESPGYVHLLERLIFEKKKKRALLMFKDYKN